MVELIKKYVSLSDAIILTLGFYWIVNMDYENFGTSEKVYIVIFLVWLVMFGVRVYIMYKNDGGKNG